MTINRLALVAVIVVAASVVGSGQQTAGWPPPLQSVSPDSPPLTPQAEMKTFFMPPGYHVELVASEPLVEDPIVIDWDLQGRMWVIEMAGYMNDITATNEHDPLGRIVVLEDTNGDGVMDKRTVFADGLVLPRAMKVLDHGVLVAEPPHLWLMQDWNGDLRADAKVLVTDNYGQRDASVEHNANSLFWALDNWMYTSEVDTFLRFAPSGPTAPAPVQFTGPAGMKSPYGPVSFDVRKTLSRGQWGVSEDDAGRIFRNTNESVLHVDLVPTQYYARNPNLLRQRGSYESLEGDHNEVNTVWPVRPTPGVNRGYQSGILRADGSLAAFTSVSSPTVYLGDRLPADLYGNVFVTEPASNVVSRIIVEDNGTTLAAHKAYERGEFLVSTDERFRPVYLSSAPDGTLYVVDMYRGIIQYKGYITEYLRDHIIAHNLEQPIARGRIYRVVHDTTRRGPAPSLAAATPQQLVDLLSHPNGWWRDTAQRLLVERHALAVVPVLTTLARSAPLARTRLHALWTLDGLNAIDVATVTRALDDSSRDVRTSAVRLAERWLGEADHPMQATLLKRLADSDWSVRRQLAASLGELPPAKRESAIATLLDEHGDDPITVDAALSGLRGDENAVIDKMLQTVIDTPGREAALAMLAAAMVRGGRDAGLQALFADVADEKRPLWQRAALLHGAEVALLNAPMPGVVARAATTSNAPAPCPTCPGARSGPGGASAFPTAPAARGTAAAAPGARGGAPAARGAAPAAATPAAGRGRGGGGPVLRLQREPELSAVAVGSGELAARATAVLARVEWPGKPGASAPVAPLTAAEQQRFNAGKEVFDNLCQACHQADGRGREKVAPSLVGSELALAPAAVTVRILLNGKEGSIGLMPPLGGMLSDDQIAGVLTYVRREWGQTGTPVDPATVKDVRALTASHTQPWTNAELLALVNAAGN